MMVRIGTTVFCDLFQQFAASELFDPVPLLPETE